MKVTLYYDVVSPYSYFAFEIFCRFQKPWNVELDLRPFFLGGVMQATSNQPPASLAARAPYLLRDLYRQSQYFQTPVQIPPDFPANTLNAMRLLTATKQQFPDQLIPLTRTLWKTHYGQGQSISTPESLLAACLEAGFDNKTSMALIEECQNPDIKDELKKQTAEAVERGAFGAPTFFIETPHGEEMFFGSDRFHLVAPLFGCKWEL